MFQAVSTLYAAAALTQPVWIGIFLEGGYDYLLVHRSVGGVLIGFSWLVMLAAILLWRPGRLPAWPIAASMGLGVLLAVQFVLGSMRRTALHLPLGVALVAGAVGLAVWSWLPRTRSRVAS